MKIRRELRGLAAFDFVGPSLQITWAGLREFAAQFEELVLRQAIDTQSIRLSLRPSSTTSCLWTIERMSGSTPNLQAAPT